MLKRNTGSTHYYQNDKTYSDRSIFCKTENPNNPFEYVKLTTDAASINSTS